MITQDRCSVPVLLVVFNRPDTTQKVFDAIRKVRPLRLFVSADAPREGRQDDLEKCNLVRQIVKGVDWDCDVKYLFHERNVGCRRNVAGGITWMFEHAESGIILEDDCLPVHSFFRYCEELLAKYADDGRIMQISGSNYLMGKHELHESYYFTKILDVTGWATWKRAWRHFDDLMTGFENFDAGNSIAGYLDDRRMQKWIMSYMREAHALQGRGIWSPAWVYALASRGAVAIAPAVHLVSHVTFGRADSNCSTGGTWDPYSAAVPGELGEIIHPATVVQDRRADAIRFDLIARTDPRLILSSRIKVALRNNIVMPLALLSGRFKVGVRQVGEILSGKRK